MADQTASASSTPRWLSYSLITLVMTIAATLWTMADNAATMRSQIADLQRGVERREKVIDFARELDANIRVLQSQVAALSAEQSRRTAYLGRLDALEAGVYELRERVRRLESVLGIDRTAQQSDGKQVTR